MKADMYALINREGFRCLDELVDAIVACDLLLKHEPQGRPNLFIAKPTNDPFDTIRDLKKQYDGIWDAALRLLKETS